MNTQTIKTTCTFCSIGCQLDAYLEDGKLVRVLPSDSRINRKKLCPKGFKLFDALTSPDRGTKPLLRQTFSAGQAGSRQEASWDKAISVFCEQMKSIKEKHGAGSIAYISTGQMTTEEMAMLGAVGRILIGGHGDGNTRQCMASAAVGYKQAFGFDAPPFSYTDLDDSDCLIFMGANPVIAHPMLWERYKERQKDDHDLVVIDPRFTETAACSTLYFGLTPKSDLTFLYTLANELIRQKKLDKKFIEANTNGFDEFKHHVGAFTRENLKASTGIDPADLDKLVGLFSTRRKISFWWTMGVNQSHQGVRTIQAIINICLMTGNIGRPGTGPNSLTGQCNAMGSRLFSLTTNLYGGRDFANPDQRNEVATILNVDEKALPGPSLAYDQILKAIDEGKIKALWIVCTNPVHSWVYSQTFQKAIKKLEFFVVQDLYPDTETALEADLYLPAAGAGEKPGFFINSERRLVLVEKVIAPPEGAKSDFEIFRLIAQEWSPKEDTKPLFANWNSVEAVFESLKEMSRGMPCDISGVTRKIIKERDGVQWPFPAEKPPQDDTRRLFEDGKFFTPDKKAKFLFDPILPLPEIPDGQFPLGLLTGRGTMIQFHTQTRTKRFKNIPDSMYSREPYIEISQEDATQMHIEPNQPVKISSRRGNAIVQAHINPKLRPGFVFAPMHYAFTNRLTYPLFDDYSREPSYKFGAVKIEKA